ncbi:hypothetical protein SLE2022_347840 [Rubroshorea leprosula]
MIASNCYGVINSHPNNKITASTTLGEIDISLVGTQYQAPRKSPPPSSSSQTFFEMDPKIASVAAEHVSLLSAMKPTKNLAPWFILTIASPTTLTPRLPSVSSCALSFKLAAKY